MKDKILFLIIIILCFFVSVGAHPDDYQKKVDRQVELLKSIKPFAYKFWVPYPVIKRINFPDLDGDGIPDREDECPTMPGVPERNGCPDIDMTKIITVARPTIIFTDEEFDDVVQAFAGLQFDLGTLLSTSHEALDRFIELFNNNPNWIISLSVYVDETPCREENMKLSENRLKEVSDYFELNGVNKKRIIGIFFGDTMPVLDLPPTRFEIELDDPIIKPKPKQKVKAKSKKKSKK